MKKNYPLLTRQQILDTFLGTPTPVGAKRGEARRPQCGLALRHTCKQPAHDATIEQKLAMMQQNKN